MSFLLQHLQIVFALLSKSIRMQQEKVAGEAQPGLGRGPLAVVARISAMTPSAFSPTATAAAEPSGQHATVSVFVVAAG